MPVMITDIPDEIPEDNVKGPDSAGLSPQHTAVTRHFDRKPRVIEICLES